MIISNLFNVALPAVPEKALPSTAQWPQIYRGGYVTTKSKKKVDENSAKSVATAYRCAHTICTDVATMPLQVFQRAGMGAKRIQPNAPLRNTAYLLEVQPNRWMVPSVWKETIANWLIWWGNAYIWSPPSRFTEFYILEASQTYPVFDQNGDKWYKTIFPNKDEQLIPDVEMVHLMINSRDGLHGMSVLEHARETIGRQMAAHETQDSISGDGLKPTAALYVDSKGQELSEASREQVRKSYIDAVGTGVAIFPSMITKFDPITMKPVDAQFLEGISLTDTDIANFFNMPLHKLNMGKQSYESNDQQELNYLKSCLNPYLVQWEQAGRLKWLSQVEQADTYLRFNRDALLQTNAETREKILSSKILNGQLSPNDALQIEDMPGYDGGDRHYMPANMMPVGPGNNPAPQQPTGGA